MDAESRISAAARRLAGVLPGRARPQTVTSYGTVSAVSGPRMTVDVAGASLDVPFAKSCEGAAKGDRVLIVSTNKNATAIAVMRGVDHGQG